jgi:hypothetical protein
LYLERKVGAEEAGKMEEGALSMRVKILSSRGRGQTVYKVEDGLSRR